MFLNLIDTNEGKIQFKQLYNEYSSTAALIARGILGDDLRCDEAVADAFTILADCVNKNKIEDVFTNKTRRFVCIITKNCALKLLKDKNKHISIHDITYPSSTDFDDNINANGIIETIEQMPQIYREVLELKVYYDLPTRRVAKILGITEANVRKRLERSKIILKQALERGDIYV